MFHKLGKRQKDKRIILETISISHYVEKVCHVKIILEATKKKSLLAIPNTGSLGDGLHEHPVRGGGELWHSWDPHTWPICSSAEGEQNLKT